MNPLGVKLFQHHTGEAIASRRVGHADYPIGADWPSAGFRKINRPHGRFNLHRDRIGGFIPGLPDNALIRNGEFNDVFQASPHFACS
jgi:hypothetical protein